MRVVAEIPPELVDEIRSAVKRGNYESPEEFLQQALRTQLEIESGEQEKLMSFSEAVQTQETSEDGQASLNQMSSPKLSEPSQDRTSFEKLPVRDFDVVTIDPPELERIDTGPLWGQYNRLFPVKLTLRRLAIVLDETNSRGVPYQQFRDDTAKVAREYGFRLEEIDQERDRGRGEKFSAALPTGDKVDRSLDRFRTHFVGQMDSSGDLTGAPPNLQLVDIDNDTNEFGITQAGLEFAQIENPILDDGLRSDSPLSDAERQFYLAHVASEHPAESRAMKIVAEAILDGIDRPDPLSERVGELSEDWTAAQANTIRSGLIGRMHELGLVSRERVGSRGIGYTLTERGRQELI